MTAPASEDLRELERQLLMAAERGEAIMRAEVQDEFGVSAQVADEMLGVLREHGKAVEVAPGEWRGPTADELPASVPEPVRVVVSDSNEMDGTVPLTVPAAVRAGFAGGSRSLEPTVRITRSIAEALDAEALGKLVHAGLGDVTDGEVFMLEVTP